MEDAASLQHHLDIFQSQPICCKIGCQFLTFVLLSLGQSEPELLLLLPDLSLDQRLDHCISPIHDLDQRVMVVYRKQNER